jgi:predicted nucleotidyltransferase
MSSDENLSRDRIIRAIVEALEPLDYVYALWEGGAVAFGRLDEWSDIDICVDAEDERVKEVFPVVKRALESLAPIELEYDMPGPLLGEYVQAFYRLAGTSKFMLIDFAVFRHSAKDKLLEPEIHGRSKFHFNKNGTLKIPHLDRGKFIENMKAKLEGTQRRFETFACFVEKEMNRGNYIEALGLYHRLILDSLVQVLRMKHKPVHYDFRTRYVHYDLPGEISARLTDLYFVADNEDLARKYRQGKAWFYKIVGDVDFEEVEQGLLDTKDP